MRKKKHYTSNSFYELKFKKSYNLWRAFWLITCEADFSQTYTSHIVNMGHHLKQKGNIVLIKIPNIVLLVQISLVCPII